MDIRTGRLEDIPHLKQLYQDTILSINAQDYSLEQITVWASTAENIDKLSLRIKTQYVYVMETAEKIIGFASLDKTGYLDMMYVHKDFQGKGIATKLLNQILETASRLGLQEITSDVSITAKPFFEHHQFSIICQQQVDIKGIKLSNYKMRRSV